MKREDNHQKEVLFRGHRSNRRKVKTESDPEKKNFIKTTYDISLDSQISLLPFGFSLQLWESR